jgi:ABC-type lipoprotein export system ATPase subunit
MGKIINIYGPSGTGKTQYITNNLFQRDNLDKNLVIPGVSPPAISLLPLPDFEGTVDEYFKIFDIEDIQHEKFDKLSLPMLNLPYELLKVRTYNTLSAGEKRRLDILRCSISSNFIIVDEPLSNSSANHHEKIFQILEEDFLAAIILSHTSYKNCLNLRIENIIRNDKGHLLFRAFKENFATLL